MDNNPSDLQIQYSKGIGPQRAKLFLRIGIRTIQDAIYYLPYRYEDRLNIKNIGDLEFAQIETIKGRIISSENKVLRGKRIKLFELVINDGTGILKGKWFNQPFMKNNFSIGQEVVLSGAVKRNAYFGTCPEIDNPEYELVFDDTDSFIHTKRIVPFYRITEGISQKQFRKLMFGIVGSHAKYISDPIPQEVIVRNNLPSLYDSIRQVHFPEDASIMDLLNRGLSIYHARLAFDELFMFVMGMAVRKKNTRLEKGLVLKCEGRLQKKLLERLPFGLTGAQKKVLGDILRDMKRPCPMNRLLQGDVGCGKTLVAFLSILNAVECGFQAALMAPTELLAEQHYANLHQIAEDLGLKSVLLSSGSKRGQTEMISSGEVNIVIGTHALIQERVGFKNLGLVVIDEQHKFGVVQRATLKKKGMNPDVLVMTATPIPRSLALTLYGDLDYSVIDEFPPGRRPVITKVFASDQKNEIYRILEDNVKKGRQAYVVYPVIEEDDKAGLKSAVRGKEAFQRIFPAFRVEMIHGRMGAAERELIMSSFKKGDIDILVSTTVIEVGVDVPNATVMLIIHAERFGLAQLHQLRGRVGRGSESSCCLLVAFEPAGEDAGRRLDVMVGSSDGFRIAEADLDIRGPGEFFGTRQAGIPDLRVADIIRDIKVLEAAKKEAFNVLEADPDLKEFPFLKKSLEVFWKGKDDFYKTG